MASAFGLKKDLAFAVIGIIPAGEKPEMFAEVEFADGRFGGWRGCCCGHGMPCPYKTCVGGRFEVVAEELFGGFGVGGHFSEADDEWIFVEEAVLTEVIGGAYADYAARTKRLVPGLW